MSRDARPVRWYTHGWNRGLSWRLILGIVPKVPRFLRPPLHVLATLVCFVAMPAERRAAQRNLARITGRRGLASRLLAFRLFYNFSKFMVAYTDLMPFRPERMRGRVQGGEEARGAIETLLGAGKGLIVVTLHLGNWEVGLAYLSLLGRPVSVVLRPEEHDAAPLARRARARPWVRTVAAGGSAWNGLELLLALRRGEIVTIQGDRPFGAESRRLPLFGAAVDLPSGPFALAQASGAPLLLVCVPIRGHSRYRMHLDGPLTVGPGAEAIDAALLDFARRVERVVGLYPTQWFNFYDVWEVTPGGSPASPRAGRPARPGPAGRSCRAR